MLKEIKATRPLPLLLATPMVETRSRTGATPTKSGPSNINRTPSKSRNTSAKASRGGASFWGRHENVALYVPNLIGYLRVALFFYAFSVAFSAPSLCLLAYFLSFVCDELDGRFARMLGQESTFGKVLDMVTDRTATLGLLALLCMLYKEYYMVPLTLTILDIFSHWSQMYTTLLYGATTHKDTASKSGLIRLYYSSRTFMGFCCVSCEVLYLALYTLKFPLGAQSIAVPLGPIADLLNALDVVAAPSSLPLAAVFALLALPGTVIKQITNVEQLRTSFARLAAFEHKGK